MENREMIRSIKKLRESIYLTEKKASKPKNIEVVSSYDLDYLELFANNNLSIVIKEKTKED